MSGIAKRVTRLSDGRELIYFDDADTALRAGAEDRRAPAHAPTAGPGTAAGPADGRVDLDRDRPPEPRVPAA